MDEDDRHDRFMGLFLQHEMALRAFIRCMVPKWEDTSDVLQNVSIVLWRKFDEVQSPDQFRPWAFGVARLEALQFSRSKTRDRHVFSDDVIALLATTLDESAESLEAERHALEECLQKLPTEHRELINLAYAPGIRIDELAAGLGRTAMSLYKALHRIRLTLMDCTQRVLARESVK